MLTAVGQKSKLNAEKSFGLLWKSFRTESAGKIQNEIFELFVFP